MGLFYRTTWTEPKWSCCPRIGVVSTGPDRRSGKAHQRALPDRRTNSTVILSLPPITRGGSSSLRNSGLGLSNRDDGIGGDDLIYIEEGFDLPLDLGHAEDAGGVQLGAKLRSGFDISLDEVGHLFD